jgi:hypothetical protein
MSLKNEGTTVIRLPGTEPRAEDDAVALPETSCRRSRFLPDRSGCDSGD